MTITNRCSESACPTSELNALNQFYTDTPSWEYLSDLNGWSSTSTVDCCQRTGIVCNNQDSVITINTTLFGMNNYNDPTTFDLSDLTNLETLAMQYNGFEFAVNGFTLPNSIKYLDFLGVNLDSYSGDFNYPNLELLKISSYSGDVQFTYSLSKLQYLLIQNVYFIYDSFDQIPNIIYLDVMVSSNTVLNDACDLTYLKQLFIIGDPTDYTSIPNCLLQKPLIALSLTGYNLMGDFPVFPNSLQLLSLEGSFDTFAVDLPSDILFFHCDTCFVENIGPITIPSTWSKYNLIYLNLASCELSGTIPQSLITTLFEADLSYNDLSNPVSDFLNVASGSYWNLVNTQINGIIPDGFDQMCNGTYLDFTGCPVTGNLPRYAFCQTDFMVFGTLPPQLMAVDSSEFPNEYYINTPLFVEYFSPEDKFNNAYTFTDEICDGTYFDPYATRDYISPVPSQGGKITIQSDNFLYALEFLMLTKGNETTTTATKQKKSQWNPKYNGFGLNMDSNQMSISFNNPVTEDTALAAGTGPYDNIVLPPAFNAYEFFREYYGFLEVQDENDNLIAELQCRLISLYSTVECLNYPQEPGSEGETPINYYIHFYRYNGGSAAESWGPNPVYYIPAPEIDSTVVDDDTDQITIVGSYFGLENEHLPVSVGLTAGDVNVGCPIAFQNDTMIVCQKQEVAYENRDAIYSMTVKVNDQISNPVPIIYQGSLVNVPSNCYGESDEICQGNGVCSATQLCNCNPGFRGIFCELSNDKAKNSEISLDDEEPTGTFDQELATAAYDISIVQVRELDIHLRVVANYTPEWERSSQNDTSSVYTATLQDGAIIQATLTILPDSTDVSFAQVTLRTDPQSLKYTVNVNGYKFATKTNSMQIVFQMSAEPSETVSENCDESSVDDATIKTDPNVGDIHWVQVERGNTQLVGKVISRALVDTRVVYVKFQTEFINNNVLNLVANVPYFAQTATIDPSYAALLQADSEPASSESKCKSNKWKIATGVVVGVVGAAAVAVGGYMLHKKKIVQRAFNKQLKKAQESTQN
ncbi:EGF-like domain-containing protein [Tieghemostelium lacteum]|uniref:EGF-like domain-containing protein n=1 Tax=Tieghemostelium lacteum TaxID=361077 RepID=A0A152A5Y2_TIELA|nr:EGF-like domain-containing protein [Tieghemostelium lacteum]|eukprot:KYR01477.1 EGF-like domain-containing protein [Tieghemostelium lacteum]